MNSKKNCFTEEIKSLQSLYSIKKDRKSQQTPEKLQNQFVIRSFKSNKLQQPVQKEKTVNSVVQQMEVMDSFIRNRSRYKYDLNRVLRTSNELAQKLQEYSQFKMQEKQLKVNKLKMTNKTEIIEKFRQQQFQDSSDESDCECKVCNQINIWNYEHQLENVSSFDELYKFRQFNYPSQNQTVNPIKVQRAVFLLETTKKYRKQNQSQEQSDKDLFMKRRSSFLKNSFQQLILNNSKYNKNQLEMKIKKEKELVNNFIKYYEEYNEKQKDQYDLLYEGHYEQQLALNKQKTIKRNIIKDFAQTQGDENTKLVAKNREQTTLESTKQKKGVGNQSEVNKRYQMKVSNFNSVINNRNLKRSGTLEKGGELFDKIRI